VLTAEPLVAVRVTTCVPGVVKLVEGSVSVDELDGPKLQVYVVPPVGVVVLWKLTSRGAHPDDGVTVNPAVNPKTVLVTNSAVISNKKSLDILISYKNIICLLKSPLR